MEFRQPTSAEMPVLGQIAAQTFGFPETEFGTFVERVGRENLRVAVASKAVIGGLATYPLGQWFGGRSIPMAGVALVCVPPERRATGVARFMMSSLLREARDRKIPLATLFASTQRPYRRVGFEQAGTWNQFELRMLHIGHRKTPLPIHQVTPLEPQAFADLANQRAAMTNGNLARNEGLWDRLLSAKNSANPVYGYLIGEREKPKGYVIFEQVMHPSFADRHLLVRDMAALSGTACDSLWAFLHDHRSILPAVRWYGPVLDPLLLATIEARADPLFSERWMLRIVDVPQALQERGYRARVCGALDLEVTDDLIPENNRRFRLEVQDGIGRVTSGGSGDIQLDVRGLSPLYTSFFDATTLQSLGWLAGPREAIEIANTIFSGPQPWMPDKF